MGSKPDFTQKLLNDLRLRKERMSGARNSDAFKGGSREMIKQSKGAKTIQPIGQKNGSTHRSFTARHDTTQQSVNQIVPYGRGNHLPAQRGDISMAISYAFDNGGNLKAFELKSNAAMVNLLQQIGKRSTQWQPTNQFPTLTHLHIDEVARGAQKLNQILKACTTGGLNVGKGSVEVGKELWKGAMDLEQSLRMLVSLQEASNCVIKPQRKSRLKLLEEGEDFDDDSSITSIVKQKQVERPIFSFDRPSKNNKGSVHTDLREKQQNQKEVPTTKSEKQGSLVSKSSHRRSASCGPDIQPSKSKNNTARLPNVIAKLMGLEEVPQNADIRVATEVQTRSKHGSGELVLKTSYGNSRGAELKTNDTKNVELQISMNRIESPAGNAQKLQEKKGCKMTSMNDNYYYRTTLDPQKNTWKEERVGLEAIHKVNELLSQMVKPCCDAEPRVSNIMQKQGVQHGSETLLRTVEKEKSFEVPNKTRIVSTGTCNTHEARDRVEKVSTNKQKKKTDIQLPSFEPQGKKLRTENISQHKAKNKSEQRKKVAQTPKSNNLTSLLKNSMQKQQNAGRNALSANKQNHDPATNALSANKQNHDPATENAFADSDLKEKSLKSLKSGQNDPLTDGETQNSDFKEKKLANLKSGQNGSFTDEENDSLACTTVNNDAKSASVSRRQVEAKLTAQRRKPNVTTVKANEIMAKTVRGQKLQKQIAHGQKPKKSERLIVSGEVQPSDKTSESQQAIEEPCVSRKDEETKEADSKHIGTTNQPKKEESYSLQDLDEQAIAKSCSSPKHEEIQKGENEHMSISNQPKNNESYRLQDLNELPPSSRNEITASVVPDSKQGQQPDKPQDITTDGHKDGECTSHNPLQEQRNPPTKVKQEPLNEDEINMKQKLIHSHLFLNTAEALFKLHIPIGILNYASDQINHEKGRNLIVDCGYELLKMKGRRKETSLYPHIGKVMKYSEIRSLDDLVRQMHIDFENLQTYGMSESGEYDEVEYILKMLERDIFYREPDLNCMWDLGWNETVFAYTDTNEVVRDMEQSLLDELLGEIVGDWF